MQILLIISNLILLLLLLEAVRRMLRYRYWLKELEGNFDSPIPILKLNEFHELFVQPEFGPTWQNEVSFIGRMDDVPGGTSNAEAWMLSVFAKQAKCMCEFGTGTGKTTYLWARNSTADARVITLTLGKDQHTDYAAAKEDDKSAIDRALAESRFDTFLYLGTPVEYKITQLFSDSKRFDETPYLKQCDLIFIDGSHAYSYVKNDTEKALQMLKAGGIILWHDYRYRKQETRGVRRYLDELSKTLPLVRLYGTSFVAYRAAGLKAEG